MAASWRTTRERGRNEWDLLFGALSVTAGGIVLGHVALAGIISVMFTGWMLVVGGVVLVGHAVVTWSDPPRRWNLAYGGLIGVVGGILMGNPEAGRSTLALYAGCLLLLGAALRVVLAFRPGLPKHLLLANGAIILTLSLLLLLRWPTSALWFLGTMLGAALIIDGIATVVTGRIRLARVRHMEADGD